MRTDGHDEANSRFSQFCERAWKGRTLVLNPSPPAHVTACSNTQLQKLYTLCSVQWVPLACLWQVSSQEWLTFIYLQTDAFRNNKCVNIYKQKHCSLLSSF
jgi:hypothetical protein